MLLYELILCSQPDPARALTMLERIASLVKPIMRKHAWTLPVLAEFFPNNPNLLGAWAVRWIRRVC